MKALVKSRAEPGLWLADVPEPQMGINDVMIRVLRTGICGTDQHIYNWDEWAQKTIPVPLVIGHEFVGEIVDVGSNVTDYRKGEIVSGEGHIVCGRCRNCMAGRYHMCANTSGVGVNRTLDNAVGSRCLVFINERTCNCVRVTSVVACGSCFKTKARAR